jgi:hypothetical protein
VDIKEEILGDQENYGFAEDVKATDLFHKAKKKNKAEKEEDNKKSHVIYNKRRRGKWSLNLWLENAIKTDYFGGKIQMAECCYDGSDQANYRKR